MVLNWVVQRNALTGALITFVSFANYADAVRHKADLEAIADPLDRTSTVAIESLIKGEFPNQGDFLKSQNKGGGFS